MGLCPDLITSFFLNGVIISSLISGFPVTGTQRLAQQPPIKVPFVNSHFGEISFDRNDGRSTHKTAGLV